MKDQFTQLLNKPVVLRIAVVILRGPECMRHSFNTVHNRTGKIIGGIHSVDKAKQSLV